MTASGTFVALVGPDGVGKTYAARECERIARESNRPFLYVHFRPTRDSIVTEVPMSARPVEKARRPIAITKPERVASILRLVRSLIIFWTGYLVHLRPVLQEGGIVVADRWIFNYLGQPWAVRYFGGKTLARLGCRAAPRPRVVVNLTAEVETIAKRKNELSETEIRQELALWREVLDGFPVIECRSDSNLQSVLGSILRGGEACEEVG